MARKPLMLMRKKGLLGSMFARHANQTINRSKSVGSFIALGVVAPPVPEDWEPPWISAFTIQPKDTQGFTVFTPDATSRIVYVDATLGNDTNAAAVNGGLGYYTSTDFADPFAPVGEVAYQTHTAALAVRRDNQPDWVLFKRGEEWDMTVVVEQLSGASISAWSLLGAYGAGARPLLNRRGGGETLFNTNGPKFWNVSGLEFYPPERDPNNAEFAGWASLSGLRGIATFHGDGIVEGNCLIEDCKLSYFEDGISFTSNAANLVVSPDYTVRRNDIRNMYEEGGFASLGLWAIHRSILVEENILDHNGWYDDTNGLANKFSHNIYMSGLSDSIFRNNIITRASSIGIKLTANITGGIAADNISMYGNLIMEGDFAISAGGNVTGTTYRWDDVRVNDNVCIAIGREQHGTTSDISWGIELQDNIHSSVTHNFLLHTDKVVAAGGFAVRIADYAEDLTITQNKSYLQGDDGVVLEGGVIQTNVDSFSNTHDLTAGSYINPTRKLESYMTSLGQTATLQAFIDKAALNTKGTWDTDYTANGANTWIKEGYAYDPAVVTAPVILTDIATAAIAIGEVYTYIIDAYGIGGLSYKWFKDGVEIGGEVSRTYLPSTASLGANDYKCEITDDNGTTTSIVSTLTVTSGTVRVTFNGTDGYASLPTIDYAGAFTWTLSNAWTNDAVNHLLFGGTGFTDFADWQSSSETIRVRIDNTFYATSTLTFAQVQNQTISIDRDGSNNLVVNVGGTDYALGVASGTFSLAYLARTSSQYYPDSLYDVVLVGNGDTHTWAMDAVKTDLQTEASTTSAVSLTYHNTVTGDWA